MTLSYCAEMVRRHDRDRFLCSLFAPAARREDLFALYAFNLEVARIRESVSEPLLGQIRLQWWRDQLDNLFADRPPAHPVARPLADAIAARGLSREPLERLLEGREADMDESPPPTMAALADYAEATSTTVMLLALESLGARVPATEKAAYHAGVGWALTGLLRAVPFHAGAGRIYLPQDLLAGEGLSKHRVLEGKGREALCRVVATVADVAGTHLAAARGLRGEVPRRAVPALLPVTLAHSYLRRLRRYGFDPFDRRLGHGTAGQQMHLALNAARGRY